MKYINSISITNFQSHVNTIINFSSGLNIFVGQSDSGKSSIIRAIKWVFFNEPKGDAFINNNANEAIVSIEFNDGTKVTRGKSASKNYYILDKGDNEIRFENFGTQVPPDIINATGINKVNLDNNFNIALNISNQLDAAFFVDFSETIRANALSRLVDANYVDIALKNTIKDKRNGQLDIKYIQNDIDRLESQKISYVKYENAFKQMKQVNEINTVLISQKSKLDILLKLHNRLTQLNVLKMKTKHEINIFKKYTDLDKTYNELIDTNIKYSKITDYKTNLSEITNNILRINSYKSYFENITNIDILRDTTSRKIKILDIITKYNYSINQILSEVKQNNLQIIKYENIINTESYITKIQKMNSLLSTIKELCKDFNATRNRLNSGKIYNNFINKILNNQNEITNIQSKYLIYKKYTVAANELSIITKNTDIIKNEINDYNLIIKDLSLHYTSLLNNLNYCPICFRPIESHNYNDIIKHLEG